MSSSRQSTRGDVDGMTRSELVAELRSLNPFGDYQDEDRWPTEQLRETLRRYRGVTK